MVIVCYSPSFQKALQKIKDNTFRERVYKQIAKIVSNPEVGKPMRYMRKGYREVYVTPYRISYAYIVQEKKIVFLALYHKDEQ